MQNKYNLLLLLALASTSLYSLAWIIISLNKNSTTVSLVSGKFHIVDLPSLHRNTWKSCEWHWRQIRNMVFMYGNLCTWVIFGCGESNPKIYGPNYNECVCENALDCLLLRGKKRNKPLIRVIVVPVLPFFQTFHGL